MSPGRRWRPRSSRMGAGPPVRSHSAPALAGLAVVYRRGGAVHAAVRPEVFVVAGVDGRPAEPLIQILGDGPLDEVLFGEDRDVHPPRSSRHGANAVERDAGLPRRGDDRLAIENSRDLLLAEGIALDGERAPDVRMRLIRRSRRSCASRETSARPMASPILSMRETISGVMEQGGASFISPELRSSFGSLWSGLPPLHSRYPAWCESCAWSVRSRGFRLRLPGRHPRSGRG